MTSAHDVGLLIARVAVGGTLAAHGCQKLFGWFGGGGVDGTAKMFDQIGFKPGKVNAVAAGLGEAGGGALLALGLATPAAGAAALGTMTVASAMHAPSGFFAQQGGFEYPAVLGTVALALAIGGPGDLSLDAVLGHRLGQSWMKVAALAATIPAAAGVIARRRAAMSTAANSRSTAEPTPDVTPA